MEEIRSVLESEVFLVAISVIAYYGAVWLRRRVNIVLLNPVLFSSVVIICFLKLADIDYKTYNDANEVINFMLRMSVIPLGFLLHKNIDKIKSRKFSILFSTFIGSVVGVLSIIGIGYLFGLDNQVILSLEPKSVTTPIALALSHSVGGLQPITALAVVVAGVFGNIAGPFILKVARINNPIAVGLAFGSASHAVGTARALEYGAIEGAVGGAAIGLMGVFTSIVLPLFNSIF